MVKISSVFSLLHGQFFDAPIIAFVANYQLSTMRASTLRGVRYNFMFIFPVSEQ
jgi:hypothetical protein